VAITYSERQRDKVEQELAWRELDYRRSNGIEVFLEWHKKNNILRIILNDEPNNQQHIFGVPNAEALEAFRHPFAYKELGASATLHLRDPEPSE